jgi:hypothetical protein
MLSIRFKFSFAMAVAGLFSALLGSWAQTAQLQEKAPRLGASELAATAADAPAGGVTVTYQNGKLMIEARNATLTAVLEAVSARIGASLDIPPGTDERRSGIFGPGSVRYVLTSFLQRSHFNYVLAGSPDDPRGVTQILVFPRVQVAVAPKEENNAAQHPDTNQNTVQSPVADVKPMPPAATQPKKPDSQGKENKDDDIKTAMDSLQTVLSGGNSDSGDLERSALEALGRAALANKAKLDAETTVPSDQTPIRLSDAQLQRRLAEHANGLPHRHGRGR